MRIKRLSYKDIITGWNISNMEFSKFTLLVGASGVGKTQILKAIQNLAAISRGRSGNGIEWNVLFNVDGVDYEWAGAFSPDEGEYARMVHKKTPSIPVVYEILKKEKEIIVNRDENGIMFREIPTVKLEPTQSIIYLLKEEDEIQPIYDGFLNITKLDNTLSRVSFSAGRVFDQAKVESFEDVRKMRFLYPIDKLFMLYKFNLPEFEEIKQGFHSVFPSVTDIRFTIENALEDISSPVLQIKEDGVSQWILYQNISSGMLRTLSQLVLLKLAKGGDVVLIDEFENSLGVNCIDEVAESILDFDEDVQFIITSHHPYIINSISYEKWRIVTRQGCDVSVHTAEELGIGAHSNHERFMQLVQLSAYKTGKI